MHAVDIFRLKNKLFFFLFLAQIFFPAAAQGPPKRVLMLFSYHPGHEWEDSIYEALIEALKEQAPGTELSLEYMNTKRKSMQEQSPVVYGHLSYYSEDSFSLIITVDDNALNFMGHYRDELFPGVPIVFCGVNAYEGMQSLLPDNVTGVVSRVNLKDTALLARDLIPDLKVMYVLTDPTPTGAGNRNMILEQLSSLPEELKDLEFRFVPEEEFTTRQMLEWTSGLSRDSALLLTSWYRDKDGVYIGEKELIKLLNQYAAVPVFNLLHIRPGVLGGKVTAGKVQAELAAGMTARILDGTYASSIPVVQGDTSIYTFDYKRLRYWGLRVSQLPPGSLILNPSAWYEYQSMAAVVIVIFVVLVGLLAALILVGVQLNQAGIQMNRQMNELYITLSSIGDGVISTDSEAHIVFMNHVAERLTGWTLQAAQGRCLHDVFHIINSQTGETIDNPVDKVLTTGNIVEMSNHAILAGKDGMEYQVADSAAPIREPGEEVIHGVVLVFRDVTESYRMQSILRKEQRRLQDAQAMALVGNWEYYPDSRQYWYSKEVFHLFGIDSEKDGIIGIDFLKEMFPQWHRGAPVPFRNNGKKGTQSSLLRVPSDEEGKTLIFLLTARLTYNPDSKKNIVTGIIQDVSELIETREALRVSQEQLRQSARMEAVGKLAGGISHEFNNLLQIIMGYAQLLKDEAKKNEMIDSMVNPILKTASNARNLTRQLLLFSRKESSDKSALSVSKLVKSLIPILSRLLEANIRLESDLEEKDDWVFGDRQQIEQVLINLSLNARDAMSGGGILKISQDIMDSAEGFQGLVGLIPAGRYVHLAVGDTGIGIHSDILPEIFDPFFTTKDKEKGTGLGLSIVYGIIKQHQGYIHIDTGVEEGTTFHIYLPQVFPDNEGEKLPDFHRGNHKGEGIIAIAEDDPMVRQLAETMIQGLGYQCKSFINGRKLLDFLENGDPESLHIVLFLLDVIMPEMGGEEVCRTIRDMGYGTPVLFSSGYTQERLEKLRAFKNTRLIHKPFTIKELEIHLNEMVPLQEL